MKLALLVLAKNEIDIIKYKLAWHKPKVDFIIVTDNGSTDGTLEFLRSQVSDNFILLERPQVTSEFSNYYNEMVLLAKEKGANWIIPSDVDEFLVGDLREETKKATSLNKNVVIVNIFKTFTSTYLDDIAEQNPVAQMTWHYPASRKVQKVLCLLDNDFGWLANGNHEARYRRHYEALVLNIELFHFIYRGYEHFKRKIIARATLVLSKPSIRRTRAVYERKLFEQYQTKGEEVFRKEWERLSADNEARLKELNLQQNLILYNYFKNNVIC